MKKKQKARKRQVVSKKIRSSKVGTNTKEPPSKSIRIERDFFIPLETRKILQRLNQAGYIAYLVGGCVRDWLLNRPVQDFDIATNAIPDVLENLFPNAELTGKSFGVIRVEGHEIATFRKDLGYQDHRHPVGVEFSEPFEDAQRRDFTINALFYDIRTKTVLDYVGGLEDLKNKTIRAIGQPSSRFKEDALRLLRAIRFSIRLGFTIEPETFRAIQMRSSLIEKISVERIRDELNRMLLGPKPGLALRGLVDSMLFSKVLPELTILIQNPTRLEKTVTLLNTLDDLFPNREVHLSWALLLLDLEDTKKLGERLRFSNFEIETLQYYKTNLEKFKEVYKMREATLIHWVSHPHFPNLLKLYKVIVASGAGNGIDLEFAEARFSELKPDHGKRILTGDDLIQLGLSPGPIFSEILQTVEDLFLEKKLRSKEEALEFVIRYFIN